MNREELEQKWIKIAKGLNQEGLELIDKLMGGIIEMEQYRIDTTVERLEEIKQEEEQRREREAEQQKEEYLATARKRRAKREERIAAFSSRERRFWKRIKSVMYMEGIDNYFLQAWHVNLIKELYENNYLNAACMEFCFGFAQGMQYMKSQARKK